jgi:hypothetical protein
MSGSVGLKGRLLIAAVAATLVIAIAAIPSFGATKQYTLDVKPNSAVGGVTTDFTITIKNTTPGNSSINSVAVDSPFPISGTPVILPPPESTNANPMATVNVAGSTQVRVQNIDSLKTNQVLKIRITATPAALPGETCSSAPDYLWRATTYAGNSLNGDTFANKGDDDQRRTVVLGCLSLRFVDGFAPTDGVINTDMDVKVEAVGADGSVVTAFTGPITIQKVSGPGALHGAGPINAVNGVADFPNFQGDTAGDYEAKATSPGVGDSDVAAFSLFADSLDCDNLSDTFPMDTTGEITIEYLDPADCTTPVAFTFTYDRDTNTFTIDKVTLTVAVKVTVLWPPELAPPVGGDLQISPTQVIPPTPFHAVGWCTGAGTTTEPYAPPSGEVWCELSQEASNIGPGGGGQQIQVKDTLLLFGDASGHR